jgi:O-succinylbenzoate synthase
VPSPDPSKLRPPKVDAVELRIVRLPLVRPFAAAHGRTVSREVLLVRVLGPDGEGWGECAADVVPTYWHETMASVWADLTASAGAAPAGPMARAAVEMALLDLQLRVEGRSLAAHLGGTAAAVAVAVTAGFEDDPRELVAAGYRAIKVKITPERCPIPRGDVAVSVDANGSLDAERDGRLLHDLDAAGLAHIEQPLPPDGFAAHAALARTLQTPIALDESIATVSDARLAIGAGAARILCVKASRLGGIDAAVRVHEACRSAGIDAKVGGMLETGIGRAAALALASLPGFTVPADLAASDRYWAEDIIGDPFVLDADGRIAVPTEPGLGVEVRVDAIEAATVERALVRL